jgi:small subunit ribosomal protein S20
MPIIKSAKKRVKVAKKANAKNLRSKRALRVAIKGFKDSISSGKSIDAKRRKAQSELDKALKKRLMHKNKVSRKQKQLSQAAKKAGKKVAKKTTAKKKTAKK